VRAGPRRRRLRGLRRPRAPNPRSTSSSTIRSPPQEKSPRACAVTSILCFAAALNMIVAYVGLAFAPRLLRNQYKGFLQARVEKLEHDCDPQVYRGWSSATL
jgi:hypothetical protein